MTEEQAVTVANTFIADQTGPDPKLDGDRYTYSLLKARMGKGKEWRIVYTLEFPDKPERVWDGPVVVVVDPSTGKATFFE